MQLQTFRLLCRPWPSTFSKSASLLTSPSSIRQRSFSTTSKRDVKTTEMSDEQLAAVNINRERLWRDLHSTCEWGKGERWGEYVLSFFLLSGHFLYLNESHVTFVFFSFPSLPLFLMRQAEIIQWNNRHWNVAFDIK
jgi:hypothetical protein